MTKRQIMLVLVGLMSGMFLSALDQSVVGSAMRTIADDLQGLELQAWATTAYLITSTISTPIYGKLGDIFGHRKLFLTAISIFIVGSMGAGMAGSMFDLAAWRAIQGVGAGGLFSLSMTILADMVPPRERARYQGMFLAVFGTSSVLGPLIGGLFAGADQILWTDGWRWVFLINLPIGAAALFMVVLFLHVPHNSKSSRIDWWGAVTIIVGVVPLLLVAEQGRDWGWDSPLSITMFVTGAIGIAAFILVEKRMGTDALIPLHLFKNITFTMSNILGVIVGVGMFGGMMTLPLMLQIVYGADPTEAGLLMLPMVAGMMTATITSGQITSRTGKYKQFMVLGTLFMTVAYFYLGFVDYKWEIWQVSLGMILLGMGLGQLMQTLTIAAQNSVEAQNIGVATSSTTFFRQMGGTLGVAIFISMLFNALGDKGAQIGEGIKDAITKNPALMNLPENAVFKDAGNLGDMISTDSSFLKTVSPELGAPIQDAFAQSSVLVFQTASWVMAIAFVLSFFVKEVELRKTSGMSERAEQAASAAH